MAEFHYHNKISQKSKKQSEDLFSTVYSVQLSGCRSPCPATYVFCLTFIPKPGPDMLNSKVLTRLDIYLKRKKGKCPTSFRNTTNLLTVGVTLLISLYIVQLFVSLESHQLNMLMYDVCSYVLMLSSHS